MQVIFDSSFLMAVAERPTTWVEDITEIVGKFEPVILDCVKSELKTMAASNKKKSRYASVALHLSAGFRTRRCGEGSVDDEILSTAISEKAVVATLDAGMNRRLRLKGNGVISLRGGRASRA